MGFSIPSPKVLTGRVVDGPISARMKIDGTPYVNFFGAGYLALSQLPEIRAAVAQALERGVPFARQLPAVHGAIDPVFDAAERAAASACGTKASVYFSTGYLVGAVGLAGLQGSYDLIVMDENAHYSLTGAAQASGVPTYTFNHCNPESLSEVLKQHVRGRANPLLLTDGVFATTGRIPPLDKYAAILSLYDAKLFVDESHAFGVIGENGRGAAEYCGVGDVAVIGTTLGKAICAQGAIVGCSTDTAERLRTIPPIGAANAGSPLSAVAATASLIYLAEHPALRTNLRAMADYLRMRLRSIGLHTLESVAPIVSFQYGSRADMQALQRRAFEHGLYIHYSTYIGAGPEGIIRCGVFRDHTRADVDALIDVLR